MSTIANTPDLRAQVALHQGAEDQLAGGREKLNLDGRRTLKVLLVENKGVECGLFVFDKECLRPKILTCMLPIL